MKNRIICILALVMALLFFVTGCRFEESAVFPYNKSKKPSMISSQTVASNKSFELIWSKDEQCVMLKHIKTQKIWSNIPYEYMLDGGASANVNSTLNIKVMNTTNRQMNSARGYIDANSDGRVFCKKIKNGVKITYCFDKYEISVPVDYVLRENSLSVCIDVNGIKESRKDYVLVSVSVAPFLCSTQNSTDNYLLIPSGCGALMYTDERNEGIRSFSAEVYGTDAARPQARVLTDEQPVRIPAFGVKSGEYALMGIIENGAESATIDAEAGNSKTGYSNVYASFYLRGYDVFEEQHDDLVLTSEEFSKNKCSVGYYFLSGNDSDYNGMAKCYRNYLQSNKLIKKSETEQKLFSVTFLGGILTTASTLGIPHKQLNAMTTLEQAESILKEITSLSESVPEVCLKGFEDYGINYGGKAAGSYKLASVYGNSKNRKSIEDFCDKNGINLYTDFDLLRFSRSGNGFSVLSDSAKTAILKSCEQYPTDNSLRQFNKNMGYRFLKRKLVDKAAEKLKKYCDKEDISGISVISAGDISYSDYSENEHYVKGNTEKDMKKVISDLKGKGHLVASGANAYAAAVSDTVFSVPVDNGDYDCFDACIPFYQMVFRGVKPLYAYGSNLSDNYKKQVMLSVIGGCGVDFALIGNYKVEYAQTNAERIFAALYEDNKQLIDELTDENNGYAKLYRLTGNSKIEKYEIIDKYLSKTVFENGVTVYANHGNRKIETPVGALESYEYRIEPSERTS